MLSCIAHHFPKVVIAWYVIVIYIWCFAVLTPEALVILGQRIIETTTALCIFLWWTPTCNIIIVLGTCHYLSSTDYLEVTHSLFVLGLELSCYRAPKFHEEVQYICSGCNVQVPSWYCELFSYSVNLFM